MHFTVSGSGWQCSASGLTTLLAESKGGSQAPPPSGSQSQTPTAPPAPGTQPTGLPPPPAAAALAGAAKLVEEVYRDDLAKAKTAEQRSALAGKMLKAAGETGDDPAGRFALLTAAGDLAAGAGDADTALDAVEQLNRSYRVDAPAIVAEAAARAAKAAGSPAAHRAIALHLGPPCEAAASADRYELAQKLAALVFASARRANDPKLVAGAAARTQELAESEQAYKEVAGAATVLDKTSTDPEANLAVGKYRCFFKGDWHGGLPLLALGSDPALNSLARQERAGASDVKALVALADGWWDLAEKSTGGARRRLEGARGRFLSAGGARFVRPGALARKGAWPTRRRRRKRASPRRRRWTSSNAST